MSSDNFKKLIQRSEEEDTIEARSKIIVMIMLNVQTFVFSKIQKENPICNTISDIYTHIFNFVRDIKTAGIHNFMIQTSLFR